MYVHEYVDGWCERYQEEELDCKCYNICYGCSFKFDTLYVPSDMANGLCEDCLDEYEYRDEGSYIL